MPRPDLQDKQWKEFRGLVKDVLASFAEHGYTPNECETFLNQAYELGIHHEGDFRKQADDGTS